MPPYSAATGTDGAIGLAACAAMRFSISGRKWRIRPWIGQAAASPSAQMVWPSISLLTSCSRSISRFSASPLRHARHHPPHPAGAFAAGRALAAAFMLVEIGQPRDRLDHVGGLVHHDHRRGAEAGLHRLQAVEIHQHVVAVAGRDAAAPRRRRGSPPADCPSRRARRRNACRSARARECPSPLRHCRACSHGRRCRTPWCRYCWDGRCRRTSRRRGAGWSGATAMRSTLLTVVGQP